jgi:hypothetical protein
LTSSGFPNTIKYAWLTTNNGVPSERYEQIWLRLDLRSAEVLS